MAGSRYAAPRARQAHCGGNLTHDPKLDESALCSALRCEAFYIGALGSRKIHRARLERLREGGFTDQQLERIHGPVGLAIGAATPGEIAVSIIAEVRQTLRDGNLPMPTMRG